MKKSMKKRKSLRKQIVSLVLATVLCVASNITVFASTPTSTANNTGVVTQTSIEPRAIGSCIASDGIITSGYEGEFTVTLSKSYSGIYVRAAATGNSNNAVICFITFPDGTTYRLGAITANGSKTSYLCYDGTAPAGNYTFSFIGTDAGTTGFIGYIYSNT